MYRYICSLFVIALATCSAFAQLQAISLKTGPPDSRPLVESVVEAYYSQADGMGLDEIVRRAFENNGDLKIAALEVDKARARLAQARLRSTMSALWMAGPASAH